MPLTRKPSIRRPHARADRKTIGVSVFAFFSAICVIGWYGLSGIGNKEDGGSADFSRQIIFAGGAPKLVTVEEGASAVDMGEEDGAEDDYVIGQFGQPASDFYADDEDDGGWGEAALAASPDPAAESI